MNPAWSDLPLIDRTVLAVERVRDRLMRSTAALDAAKVPYAVIGGNAVAASVATVDSAAVRNTQGVDILLRRPDLASAKQALETAGFVHRHVTGIDMFLDGPNAKARDAVQVIFSGEKVRPEYVIAPPDIAESARPNNFSVLTLEALVRMKLTSFRDKDRTHLRDFLDVGLIDVSWKARFVPVLADRLQQLIDTPEG